MASLTKSACLADLSAETLVKAEAWCEGRRWAKRFSIRAKGFQGSANSVKTARS
jgi:hypothetical protein